MRPPLRDRLLALVEDAPEEERLARARGHFQEGAVEYETVLGELIEQPSETVRCMVAYQASELGLTSLRGRLGVLTPGEGGLFRAVLLGAVLNPVSVPAPKERARAD